MHEETVMAITTHERLETLGGNNGSEENPVALPGTDETVEAFMNRWDNPREPAALGKTARRLFNSLREARTDSDKPTPLTSLRNASDALRAVLKFRDKKSADFCSDLDNSDPDGL